MYEPFREADNWTVNLGNLVQFVNLHGKQL